MFIIMVDYLKMPAPKKKNPIPDPTPQRGVIRRRGIVGRGDKLATLTQPGKKPLKNPTFRKELRHSAVLDKIGQNGKVVGKKVLHIGKEVLLENAGLLAGAAVGAGVTVATTQPAAGMVAGALTASAVQKGIDAYREHKLMEKLDSEIQHREHQLEHSLAYPRPLGGPTASK